MQYAMYINSHKTQSLLCYNLLHSLHLCYMSINNIYSYTGILFSVIISLICSDPLQLASSDSVASKNSSLSASNLWLILLCFLQLLLWSILSAINIHVCNARASILAQKNYYAHACMKLPQPLSRLQNRSHMVESSYITVKLYRLGRGPIA